MVNSLRSVNVSCFDNSFKSFMLTREIGLPCELTGIINLNSLSLLFFGLDNVFSRVAASYKCYSMLATKIEDVTDSLRVGVGSVLLRMTALNVYLLNSLKKSFENVDAGRLKGISLDFDNYNRPEILYCGDEAWSFFTDENRFENLEQIVVVKRRFGDSPCYEKHFKNLHKLKKLNVVFAQNDALSEKALEYLSKCENLKLLRFENDRVSESALDVFAQFKNLLVLQLNTPNISKCGIEELQKVMPRTLVIDSTKRKV